MTLPVAGYIVKKTIKTFDSTLAREQLTALQELFKTGGAEYFCRHFISILGKKSLIERIAPRQKGERVSNRLLVPYRYNRMQRDMEREFVNRNITLKERQGGSTTHHTVRRIFVPTILEPGTFSVIIGQTHTYARIYFAMVNRAHRHFGKSGTIDDAVKNFQAESLKENVLHTVYSSKRELVFDFLESQIFVDSSENEEVGQGLPGVMHLLCSEFARWKHNPEETMANLTEAVQPGGTIDIESTANGMGGPFYEEWMRSKNYPASPYKPHFYQWWWGEDYTDIENPVAVESLNEEEKKMRDLFHWTLAQVAWRRTAKSRLRHNFAEKYPEDDMSAFLTSGGCFFDIQKLRDMKIKLSANNKPGVEIHCNGDYLIYKRRVPGRRYLIALDLAEGKEIATDINDFNAGPVIDIDTGEQMASYHSQCPPDEAADEAIDIAKEYNNAMISWERNNYGGAFYTQLKNRRWHNIYEHKEAFKDMRISPTGEKKENFVVVPGFPTNPKTRPHACNELSKSIRENPDAWKDEKLVDEALNFVRDKKTGKPAGNKGTHDDRVLGAAIACYVRGVRLGWIDPLTSDTQNYGDTGEPEEKMESEPA